MTKSKSDTDTYRQDMDEIARETGWTLRRFAWPFAGLVIFLSVLGFGLNSVGLIGRTAVEREVFEQSYQRSAAQEARFNTMNAELTAVQARLAAGSLTDVQRADLQAQAAALTIQINQMEK